MDKDLFDLWVRAMDARLIEHVDLDFTCPVCGAELEEDEHGSFCVECGWQEE